MDGDADVDAEHAGEDRGRQFGSQGEQGGGAGRAGLDAQGDQALAESVGADVLPGALTREQPGTGIGMSDHGVGPAAGDQVDDEAGQRLGQDGWCGTELDLDLSFADSDVVWGEGGDGAQALGVEQEQQSRDSVRCRDRVVAEQFAGVGPAFFGVQSGAGAGPADGAVGQAGGVPVLDRPSDEVTGFFFVAGVIAGNPAFQIGLGAVGQRQSLGWSASPGNRQRRWRGCGC